MSIIDAINLNTTAVTNAKMSLQDAINAKGGGVPETDNFPTFRELLDGVDNIVAVNDIGGAEEVVALAVTDIPKGTACLLIDAAGGFEAVETIAFPETAKQGTSTVSLTGDVIKLDREGKVIIRQSTTTTTISGLATYQYYAFYLKNGVYQQLKYNGNYAYVGGTSQFTYAPPYVYDTVTNNLFWTTTNAVWVLHLDFENLNIVPLYTQTSGTVQTGALGSIKGYGCRFAYNNNFIIRGYSTYEYSYMYKYNPDTNTLTFIGDLSELIGVGSSSYSTLVVDTTVIGDYLYMLVWSKYGTTNKYASAYLVKFLFNTSSGEYVYQSKVSITYDAPTSGVFTKLHMNLEANLVMFQHYNTSQLHAFTVNPTLMTKAERTLSFSDGLDKTKLNGFAMVRSTNYLYVRSTDTTSYSEAELVRLYEYNSETGVYNFICCPAVSFSPATASNVLPSHYNLDDGAYTPFQKSDDTYAMYKVGKVSLEYDVTAEPCDNTLVENISKYGITTEDISFGQTGKAVVIFK